MLVAVMSDVHDEEETLKRALNLAEEADCTHLLYLGDFVSTDTLRCMRATWRHPMDIVAGNNDYPRSAFHTLVREYPDTRFSDESTELELDGRRIYMAHVPGYSLRKAATDGLYDAIFYGHTHRADLQRIGHTIIANPGDIQGRFGNPSFAIYNTADNSLRFLPLSD